MTRRGILEVTEKVINILRKEKESSVSGISNKLGAQWRTTLKSLEFLNKLGIVKERKGKKTNKEERLFSLVEKREEYNKK